MKSTVKSAVKSAVLPLAAALLLAVTPAAARATGFGLGLSFSDSQIDITDVDGESVDYPSYGSSASGVSFVLDTAVAKPQLFNYRLSLSYERQEFDEGGAEIDRLTWGNTFGFALVQTAPVRVWLGPRLLFGFGFDNNFDDDYLNFNAGLAPVFGVNFNLGPVVSLGLEVGYDVSIYLESWGDFQEQAGTRNGPFLNAVILFRTPEDRWFPPGP